MSNENTTADSENTLCDGMYIEERPQLGNILIDVFTDGLGRQLWRYSTDRKVYSARDLAGKRLIRVEVYDSRGAQQLSLPPDAEWLKSVGFVADRSAPLLDAQHAMVQGLSFYYMPSDGRFVLSGNYVTLPTRQHVLWLLQALDTKGAGRD